MRWLYMVYNLLWLFILPIALLRLLWRARYDSAHLEHISERLGFYPHLPDGSWILVHAVSVGETRAAQPLIEALLEHSSKINILLTHMTLTGYQTGTDIFAYQIAHQRLRQAYLPYDLPCFIKRFIKQTRPILGLLMETEVWPNLVLSFKKYAIPLVLVNARMSLRSFNKAARFGKATHTVFGALSKIIAQADADAQYFRRLGAKDIQVCGNLKFDMQSQTQTVQYGILLRQSIGHDRPVFCAASTREGEETLILNAWQNCRKNYPWFSSAVLLLVPRHPYRCDEIVRAIRTQGLTVTLRSSLGKDLALFDHAIQVLVGDSLGEMAMYYSASDIALIGGSLLPFGGQNLIEACALGKPVLFGPHMFNFLQASEAALSHGAAIQVLNENDLSQKIAYLLQDKTQQTKMGLAALEFAQTYRGATANTMQILLSFLVS